MAAAESQGFTDKYRDGSVSINASKSFYSQFRSARLLTECVYTEKDVQGLVEEAGPDLTPTDNEAVASNEVEPEEEQFTFRIFHEDVSKNHQGHGYIDLYDSRWSSGQSYNVCHVTLAAQASLLDVLHEAVKRTRPEADADYFQLYVMDASMETVPNAPKLGITTLDTKLGVVRRVHPLRCLWLVHLPSRRS